jgi:transposase
MRYVGADAHKHYTVFCVLMQEGEMEQRVRVENRPDHLKAFLSTIPRPATVALEAGYHWTPLLDLVEESGLKVVPVHPSRVKLIAQARVKTDTIDATTVAHLLRLGYLPTAYIPPPEVRYQRELLRHRAQLGRMRAQVKNRIHTLLAKNGVSTLFSYLFGKRGRVFLEGVQLPPHHHLALRQHLTRLIPSILSSGNWTKSLRLRRRPVLKPGC